MAKAVGMRNGSKAWILRPVGRISGARIRSPPGTGAMKCPPSARSSAPISSRRRARCARARHIVPHRRPAWWRSARARLGIHGLAQTCSPSGISASSVSSSRSHSPGSRPSGPPPRPDRRSARVQIKVFRRGIGRQRPPARSGCPSVPADPCKARHGQGGVRCVTVIAFERRLASVASDGLLAA
jgi:hypothetical protein